MVERILVEAGLDNIIRPGMGHVLFALYEQDEQTIKEVAARSTLTGLINCMEKAELIERRRDGADADARLVRLRLTTLGRKPRANCHEMLRHVSKISHDGMQGQNIDKAKAFCKGKPMHFGRTTCVWLQKQRKGESVLRINNRIRLED